ncbi:hypothetical protein U9M48_007079 [Paspalum notatum var. saurae]|uniref:Pseudouridine synthase RsuA/RluA-like domain-containing protein n=1 Tax=Paspalum notatum var. saurae TaxID=547442 RepID=A0AAQ3SGQ7_PASNO
MAAATGEAPVDDGAPPLGVLYSFGTPWADFNQGLSYTDTFRCDDAGAGTTLIEFYATNYKSSAPLPGWINRIHNGQITVDAEVVTDPNLILRDGSKLVYHRLPWQEPFAPYLLEVLYEDDDMVALNKPSGLQVLPKGLFQQRTVLAQLQLRDWKMTSSCHSRRKDVQSHPVPVHRLGRGTSGLLLCAKTKVAKVRLASYFAEGATNAANKRDKLEFGEERKISKFYRALVTGILDNDEVVVTQPIGLVHYPGVAEGLYAACSSDDPLYGIGGHPKFVEPETTVPDSSFAYDGGYERPSQPVPGDCGYHLHAHWLVLCHPTTNKMVKITAPLPPILHTREEHHAEQVGD